MKRRGRKVDVRCERMSRYTSHWSLSFLFIILLLQCGKLANFSIGQPSASTRMAGETEGVSGGTTFDDDANFHRDYIVKYSAIRDEVRRNETLRLKSISKSPYQVSSKKDQSMLDRLTHSEPELNGDLLAIETSDKSQLFSQTLPQHQNHRSPPYATHEQFIKTNHSVLAEPNQPIEPMQRPSESQLIKLDHTPVLVPIYLRHSLPSSVTQPKIIAFEHPASVRKQAGSTSHNQDGYSINSQRAEGGATFALLPSWPKIYIAQREQSPPSKLNNTFPSNLDPKVPTIYPNWSTHNVSNGSSQINTLAPVAQQQQLEPAQVVIENEKTSSSSSILPKVNLTASEIEYEETPNSRKFANREENSNEITDWAKLLRQAAKSDVMESLMLTNKSVVSLLCDADSMLVRLKFRQPFHGLVETNLDPNEQCRLFGNGSHYYEMRIDLYGCGTRQEMPRLFINNLQIQYQHPLSLMHSRLHFLQNQQRTAVNNQLSHVEELKTIICSYPIRPQAQIPTRGKPDPSSSDLNLSNDFSGGHLGQKPATNLSERIIEVPSQDGSDSARLFYYEPILMISGLLLLTIACTLALITSAYLMRRRHQKLASRSSSTIRSSSQLSSPDGLSGSPMRIYNRSPAQMANRRSLLAPPLIGLSKEESLPMRPSMKQYPIARNEPRRDKPGQGSSTRPAHTKEKATSWPHPSTKQHPGQSSTTSDTSDSLDSHSRGDQSSVTTIEIPYVNHSVPEISMQPSAKTSGKRKLERDEAVQADLRGRSEVSSYSEYKQIKRHEEIIETTYKSEPNEASKVAETDQATSTELRTQSPIPFGSFRSKLTSPTEFKRLQNIKRLFEDSRGNQDPTSSVSRLRMRISRTLSEPERRRLVEMLSTDEVFRSNILDSIDRQTFSRKLKKNSNYSAKFSDVTWKLLEEILLYIDLDESMFEAAEVRKSELASLPLRESSSKHNKPTRGYLYHNPTATALDKRRSDGVDASVADSGKRENVLEADRLSDSSTQAIRVSQSNSTTTRIVPDGSVFNVDSITNISSPMNTSYTSSFEQTTKYEEMHHVAPDSLPYMDELSQGSSHSQSSLALDEKHQRQRQRK